jgi:nucleotide-binding universal stress UspA family protein
LTDHSNIDDGSNLDAANHADGRIVVGVDGSGPSKDALRWAARYAKLVGGKLDMVTTWDYPTSFGWIPPYPEDFDPQKEASRALAQTAEEVLGSDPGVEVTATVTQGHPAPVLVDASRGASLLVVGCRGHGEFVGMLIGSVSEHCVANAHCPVVVIRGDH